MKVREAVRAVLGGCVVYAVMAACSASHNGAAVGSLGAGGGGGNGITDPVSDAHAGEPYVVTVKCDKTGESNGSPVLYAEYLVPGRTMVDLAGVHAIVHLVESDRVIPGYENMISTPAVADGRVAIYCGGPEHPGVDSVTFILPP